MKKFSLKALTLALSLLCIIPFAACGGENDNGPAAHRDAENAVVKKGVCVSRYNDGKSSSAHKINDLNAGWHYTWGVKTNNEYINSEFVPMIWGKNDVTQENIDYVKANYESGRFSHLLTFNEPDLADQSNMTVDEALSYWERLQSIGIPLSSPVVSWYSAESGNPWLDAFMQKAAERNYRVDFITIHIYQSFYSAGAANDLKKTLDALYAKYKKPVWLTEFGAIDIIARDSHAGKVSPNCTAKNAQNYVTQTTNMLEQCGYVERYSWFVDNFAGLYGDARPWEAPYTTLYNDDDTIAETGTTYKGVASNFPLVLETEKLQAAKKGAAYSQTIAVCGGTGDYTFTASGLPQGVKISQSGKISGVPQTSGIYQVKITVNDGGAAGRRQARTHAFTLTVSA